MTKRDRMPGGSVRGWAALVSVLLSACGGGSSTDEPVSPVAQPPAMATYRIAQLAHDGNRLRWLVVDPLAIDNRLEALIEGSVVSWARSPAVSINPAAGTTTQLGDRLLTYLSGGRLYRIDLLGSANPIPARVSSLEGLCQITDLVPLQADGSVAVLAATQKAVGAADCAGPTDTVLVRTDAGADATGQNLGQGRLLGGLPNTDGSVTSLLLSKPGSSTVGEALQLRSTTLNVLPDPVLPPPPPPGSRMAWLGVDPSTTGLGYVAMGGQAWAVRWSGSNVSIDSNSLAPLEATDVDTQLTAQGGSDGLYVADAGAIYRLKQAQATLLGRIEARYPEFDKAREFRGLHLTANHVVVYSSGFGLSGAISSLHEVFALPRAGGAPQLLTSTTSGSFRPSIMSLTPLGATESHMLVTQTTCGSLGCFGQLLTLDPQAGTTTAGPSVAGVLRATTAPTGTPGLVTRRLVYADGNLQEQSAADGGSPITLGSLGQQEPSFLLLGHEGLPLGFSGQTLPVDAAGRTDAWLLQPGVAASLQRLTRYLP